jgi:hypothetical protein
LAEEKKFTFSKLASYSIMLSARRALWLEQSDEYQTTPQLNRFPSALREIVRILWALSQRGDYGLAACA